MRGTIGAVAKYRCGAIIPAFLPVCSACVHILSSVLGLFGPFCEVFKVNFKVALTFLMSNTLLVLVGTALRKRSLRAENRGSLY
jgi:hypothetical protein